MATPLTADVVRAFAPGRPEDGHKGTFGHALIVAGSPGLTGAGCLAAEAAARAGAGRVTVACPAGLNTIFECKLTELMTLPVAESADRTFTAASVDQVLAAAGPGGAVGLGPGLGRHEEAVEFVRQLLPRLRVPTVVDADGLNAIAACTDTMLPPRTPCVLTPHPGEMARLTGLTSAAVQADRAGVATRFAEQWKCVVVLKGAGTLVAAPAGPAWHNTTGNQGLASGGTGDVLTGLIAGLLAQGAPPEAAAGLGVYLHGRAADAVAAAGNPRALIAGDLLPALAAVWRDLMGEEPDGAAGR